MMENQIGQWIVIGIAVAFIAFERAKKLFGKSNNPGYEGRITKLETEMTEIKRRLGKIDRKLNGLG